MNCRSFSNCRSFILLCKTSCDFSPSHEHRPSKYFNCCCDRHESFSNCISISVNQLTFNERTRGINAWWSALSRETQSCEKIPASGTSSTSWWWCSAWKRYESIKNFGRSTLSPFKIKINSLWFDFTYINFRFFFLFRTVDSTVNDWIACIICKFGTSDAPNQIVLCDSCGICEWTYLKEGRGSALCVRRREEYENKRHTAEPGLNLWR